jgi:hypothetical protein
LKFVNFIRLTSILHRIEAVGSSGMLQVSTFKKSVPISCIAREWIGGVFEPEMECVMSRKLSGGEAGEPDPLLRQGYGGQAGAQAYA